MSVAHAARAYAPPTVLLLLVGYFALQPLSTDFYLPSLPGMVGRLDTTVARVQFTLSVFIAGFGIGQLVLGPVSDRYGRRPVLLGGIVSYLVASIVCALALNVEMLIAGRLMQAVGVSAAIVGARAIVRDLHAPADGARVLTQVNAFMTLVLLAGPITGGFLESHFGFRATFGTLVLIAALLLFFTWRRMRETIAERNPHAVSLAPMLAAYRRIAANRVFWAYTLAMAASYGGMFAFLSGSSFVLLKILGMSAQAYGFAFAVAVIGYFLGTQLCRRWIVSLGIRRTLVRAGLIQVGAGASMAGFALGGLHDPLAILVPQFFYNMAHAITTPCSQAGAIAPFPQNAGAAAALMGFVQMLVAAGVGIWIGASYDGTVLPLTLTIAAGSLCTWLVAQFVVAHWGRVDEH